MLINAVASSLRRVRSRDRPNGKNGGSDFVLPIHTPQRRKRNGNSGLSDEQGFQIGIRRPGKWNPRGRRQTKNRSNEATLARYNLNIMTIGFVENNSFG
jgi:hypothetical protein